MSIKFNLATGEISFVNGDNFSPMNVPEGTILSIPLDKQMIIEGSFDIVGDIDLRGSLSVI